MGLFMDTFEDNLEKKGQYLDGLVPSKPMDIGRFTPVPTLIRCPLCGEVVIDESTLKQHFMDKHANRYAYIRADGKIVRDNLYVERSMSSLSAHLINIPNAKIMIEATGLNPVEMDFSGEVSILEHIRTFNMGEIIITIHTPGGTRQYHIYCGNLPEIKIEEIDRASSDLLFFPLNENIEPNWAQFKKSLSFSKQHQLERRYADGLYEYAIGIHMVSKGQDGKDRLESALEHLSPFRTPYALTIQRVLALRMNLFGLLSACRHPSRFAAVNDFFNNLEMHLDQMQANDFSQGSQEYVYVVYIDPFTEMFIDAINTYYNGDYGILEDLCGRLKSLCYGMDRNNRDKLLLLQARTALKRNDIDTAKSFYELLVNNPDFNKEAREKLNGIP